MARTMRCRRCHLPRVGLDKPRAAAAMALGEECGRVELPGWTTLVQCQRAEIKWLRARLAKARAP